MAIDLYQPFINPIAKESFRCLSYTPQAYVMEWIVQPEGYVPLVHTHVNQDEIFHIKQGEIRLVIDGVEHFGKPGDTLVVPKGAIHVAYNSKPEVLSCVVEYTPGLDHYKFFQCFGGLTIDGDIGKNGSVNIPRMLYFMKRMNAQAVARPANVPALMMGLMLTIFGVIGQLAGWEKQYLKYTEPASAASTRAILN